MSVVGFFSDDNFENDLLATVTTFWGGRFYDLPLFLTYIKQALDAWFTFVLVVQNVS